MRRAVRKAFAQLPLHSDEMMGAESAVTITPHKGVVEPTTVMLGFAASALVQNGGATDDATVRAAAIGAERAFRGGARAVIAIILQQRDRARHMAGRREVFRLDSLLTKIHQQMAEMEIMVTACTTTELGGKIE